MQPVKKLGEVKEQFPLSTINLINGALLKAGLTQEMALGVIAVVSTEGGFYPKNEISWKNTDVARIRDYFKARVDHLTDAQLDVIKKDDYKFFEIIYGWKSGWIDKVTGKFYEFGKLQLGNIYEGDGYKYRGRGFNGITGRALYAKYSAWTGIDLINNPDLLNEPEIAAQALAGYFVNGLKTGQTSGLMKQLYNVADSAHVKNLNLATRIAFQANAGWGTNLNKTDGLVHEHSLQLTNLQKIIGLVKANPVKAASIGIGSILLLGGLFFLVNHLITGQWKR